MESPRFHAFNRPFHAKYHAKCEPLIRPATFSETPDYGTSQSPAGAPQGGSSDWSTVGLPGGHTDRKDGARWRGLTWSLLMRWSTPWIGSSEHAGGAAFSKRPRERSSRRLELEAALEETAHTVSSARHPEWRDRRSAAAWVPATRRTEAS